MSLVTPHQVVLNLDTTDRTTAIRTLAETLVRDDRLADLEGFLSDVQRREEQMATGLPGGVAIPHSRSRHVNSPSIAFGRSDEGIAWGAADGPARLVFLIAVPEGGASDQLAVLAQLARRLAKPSLREQLLTMTDPQEIAELLDDEVVRS